MIYKLVVCSLASRILLIVNPFPHKHDTSSGDVGARIISSEQILMSIQQTHSSREEFNYLISNELLFALRSHVNVKVPEVHIFSCEFNYRIIVYM